MHQKRGTGHLLGAAAGTVFLLAWLCAGGQDTPRTGPATEKRFPPLQLPAGFRATLFACDPLIEYPSALAAGPTSGTVFVAIDYMTGLGTAIVRRDEIRLLEDTDGDGYADRATVYAGGFNSIQGLAHHEGTVYVMHAPFLTALRDTNGDGQADERRDLLTGLGLPPEQNPVRLHCANGVAVGHDGWLYLALGDNGCTVPRPEGDRLVLHGGGILRCRPDGRDLHVFAVGLRNIYDVALDDELTVFVRDNENDGGDYKVRLCHSYFGADHGYPYLYHERPDEALPPLADLGLGSSAGGLCYRETAFPPEYHGNLFFCEWGRAVMRYRPARAGGTLAPLKEIEFAAGAANDSYGFKPTDLVVQRDGALLVADWADGQRPKRGRGRIYRITWAGEGGRLAPRGAPTARGASSLPSWLAQLDAESYYQRAEAQAALMRRGQEGLAAVTAALKTKQLGVRGRLHAVWILAQVGGLASMPSLVQLARTDADPRVQAQAVRAVADLADPVLIRHRLDADTGDAEVARRLAELAPRRDPRVLLEVVIALGRLRWPETPAWLRKHLGQMDAALAHAAMQTLRRTENWPAILALLDERDATPIRAVALRAVADRFSSVVVDGLINRLRAEPDPARRREYADALTRVHKKPGPWVYWGYRPPPRPANTVTWERTETIEQALQRLLADADSSVRLLVLRRMQREQIPTPLAGLARWLGVERASEAVAALLDALRTHPAREVRPLLVGLVGDKGHAPVNRLTALAMLVAGLDEASAARLLELAGILEDGPVLAEMLRHLGTRSTLKASRLLLSKSRSPNAEVRSAALDALAELRVAEAASPARKLLDDPDARVRRAAATVAGRLSDTTAADPLLKLLQDSDPTVRRASFAALRLLREPRVVPPAVTALADVETQVAALHCISTLGGSAQARAVAALALRNPSADVLPLAVRTLTRWGEQEPARQEELDRTVAELHGSSGVLVRWQVTGPLAAKEAAALVERSGDVAPHWPAAFATGLEARVTLGPGKSGEGSVWLAQSEAHVTGPTSVQFLASSSGTLRVWLNGRAVYQRDEVRKFQPDSDRFEAALDKGLNRILVQVIASRGQPEFHVRFRRRSTAADHERLTQAALTRTGNAARGRKVFLDTARSQCLKCHRLGDQGERIGPELTGVGSRFSRIHLIESILEPGRTVAPSFETVAVALKDGRVVSGLRVAESATTLTLADSKGDKHELDKSRIEERRTQPGSTMPEGLEKPFTLEEFVDLIAFLASQRQGVAGAPGPKR